MDAKKEKNANVKMKNAIVVVETNANAMIHAIADVMVKNKNTRNSILFTLQKSINNYFYNSIFII